MKKFIQYVTAALSILITAVFLLSITQMPVMAAESGKAGTQYTVKFLDFFNDKPLLTAKLCNANIGDKITENAVPINHHIVVGSSEKTFIVSQTPNPNQITFHYVSVLEITIFLVILLAIS